jgi:hypothetical protein
VSLAHCHINLRVDLLWCDGGMSLECSSVAQMVAWVDSRMHSCGRMQLFILSNSKRLDEIAEKRCAVSGKQSIRTAIYIRHRTLSRQECCNVPICFENTTRVWRDEETTESTDAAAVQSISMETRHCKLLFLYSFTPLSYAPCRQYQCDAVTRTAPHTLGSWIENDSHPTQMCTS